MAKKPKILAFAGSLRKDSYNKKFVQVAADCARRAGAEVTYIDLADYPLPLMDEDLERANGLPQPARQLKQLFNAHEGLLISTAEYNSSLPAVLKNVIDWVSRKERPDEAPLRDFNNKVALLLGASPGALGGLRCLVHLRAILSNINVLVLPQQHALAKANEAFNDDGSLKDEKVRQTVDKMAVRFVEVICGLQAPS